MELKHRTEYQLIEKETQVLIVPFMELKLVNHSRIDGLHLS